MAMMMQEEVPGAAQDMTDAVPQGDDMLTDDAELTYRDIDELQALGIGAGEITKLKDAGISTARGVLQMHSKNLSQIKGLSEAKIIKLKEAANKICPSSFSTAKGELSRREQQVFRITTGASELDKIIGGGMESQTLTEIHGEWRTGKTQICHTMCITAQLPDEATGYTGGRIVYIDTEGTFRPERLKPIAERYNLDFEAAMENIFFMRALNSEHQRSALMEMAGLLNENKGVIKLVIIDSIMALYRVDYQGRGELQKRQSELGQFLHQLKQLCEEYNVAAVMTNQMTSDPSGGMTFVADPKKPIGGHVLAHTVQTRLSLRKGSGEDRIAKLVDSTTMPMADATFTITEEGITDSK